MPRLHLPFLAALVLLLAPVDAHAADAPPPTVRIQPGQGVTVTSDDGAFSTTLRARLQLRDTLSFGGGATPSNDVQIKTIRLFLQGHAFVPELKWLVQLALGAGDFETGNGSPIFDAWIEHTGLRDLNVRAGQFFVPFDRARTIREFALEMVDRPLVVQELGMDRDAGIALTSSDLGGVGLFSYALGLFGGEGRNRVSGGTPAEGALIVGRLSFHPLGAFDEDVEGDLDRRAEPKLAIGIAGAQNAASHRVRSTFGDTYKAATFDYVHADADLVFKWRGFSLLLEGLFRAANRASAVNVVSGSEVVERSREAWGVYAQAGFFVAPQWEVVGRYAQLGTLTPGTDPTLVTLVRDQGREAAAGVSWYLNGHRFKVQADVVHRWGSDLLAGRELVRFQADATF